MNKQLILKALKELREKSTKRKFSQSIDLLINLKEVDLKKQENKIDLFLEVPHRRLKDVKIAAIVDTQLVKQAKSLFNTVLSKEDIITFKGKIKQQKKLANTHDFFIAQTELMVQIASVFGKVLGARGKMPSPKAGCVVPGSANLQPLKEKLQKTIRIQTKNEASIKASVGDESMSDDQLADNILIVYNNLATKLPNEVDNIKYTAIKLTMGPLFKVEEK